MLSLYVQTFLTPPEEVMIYPSKLFRRNICNFLTDIFFSFFRSEVTIINSVLQATPEEGTTTIKAVST
jgi:hypothetical protein